MEAKEINTLSKVLRISAYYDNCRLLKNLSHLEAIDDIRSHANEYFPEKIIDYFIKAIEKNHLQDDYCEERNYTIGQLTEEEKHEVKGFINEDTESNNTTEVKKRGRKKKENKTEINIEE